MLCVMLFYNVCLCLEKRKKERKIKSLFKLQENEKYPSTRLLVSEGLIIPIVVYKEDKTECKSQDTIILDRLQSPSILSLNVPIGPLCSSYDSTEVITQVWKDVPQMGDMYRYKTFKKLVLDTLYR